VFQNIAFIWVCKYFTKIIKFPNIATYLNYFFCAVLPQAVAQRFAAWRSGGL
jgi:hypothetical protein